MPRRSIALVVLPFASACSLLPGSSADSPNPNRVDTSRPPVVLTQDAKQCVADLSRKQAVFAALPDKYYGAGCSTLNTVSLDALKRDEGTLTLANLGAVSCPLAATFADWARYGVDRAALQQFGQPLKRIETFGSYSCRNVAGSSRRSAHATAQAIDVSAFVLADGTRISLVEDWDGGTDAEREFLRIVHRSACKRFGTVLGPDYNRDHRDHFHLEATGGGFCR